MDELKISVKKFLSQDEKNKPGYIPNLLKKLKEFENKFLQKEEETAKSKIKNTIEEIIQTIEIQGASELNNILKDLLEWINYSQDSNKKRLNHNQMVKKLNQNIRLDIKVSTHTQISESGINWFFVDGFDENEYLIAKWEDGIYIFKNKKMSKFYAMKKCIL